MPGYDEQEANFLKWYSDMAPRLGLNPNPDDPRHYYDYRGLFSAMRKGMPFTVPDNPVDFHFPSQFKREGHPNIIVDGYDTRTGRKVR